MEATKIIEYLRSNDFTVEVDGDFLKLLPSVKVTDELIQRLRKHKPAILAELKREERRQKVLAMLAEKPDSQRTMISDLASDRDDVILSIAIRDLYTFEMIIPREKYDAFLLLKLIEKAQIQ